jgi:hypothetical protein
VFCCLFKYIGHSISPVHETCRSRKIDSLLVHQQSLCCRTHSPSCSAVDAQSLFPTTSTTGIHPKIHSRTWQLYTVFASRLPLLRLRSRQRLPMRLSSIDTLVSLPLKDVAASHCHKFYSTGTTYFSKPIRRPLFRSVEKRSKRR